MKLTSTRLALATIAFLSLGVNALAQTFTAIMNGENSEKFVFLNNNTNPRSTVTSIQSPFPYPDSNMGSPDTQTYPAGNSSLTPPWWFYYSGIDPNTGLYIEGDATPNHPGRSPSYGQTSSQKSAVIGIRPLAAFSGSVSGSSGEMLESIYFSERADWGGQREFGFFRQMNPCAPPCTSLDKTYFYWSTNSNCSISDNSGYPWCRASEATTGNEEDPSTAPLVKEYLLPTEITGLTTGTMYYYTGYLFWATWDSTYKFRAEAWDSTHSIQITAFNVGTSSGGVDYGATTSGMAGYVTLGTLRADPNNMLSSSGIQLSVTSIEIVQ
jgi:hypothetical protein